MQSIKYNKLLFRVKSNKFSKNVKFMVIILNSEVEYEYPSSKIWNRWVFFEKVASLNVKKGSFPNYQGTFLQRWIKVDKRMKMIDTFKLINWKAILICYI